MYYPKYSLLFSYSLLTVFIHAFSPPFQNIIARVQDRPKYLDHESAIRSRELEDLLDPTAPSSTATNGFLDEKLTPVDPNMPLDLNVFDPQPPQLEPGITSTNVKNDQLSSLENQGNLLQYDGSQKLALLPGDTDGLPIIGPLMGGPGEINIGPNPIQQLMDNFLGPSFNPKTQPEPKCKDRVLRYGGPSLLLEMFAFCCKGPAHYTSRTIATGTEAQRRASVGQRRKDCALSTVELRAPEADSPPPQNMQQRWKLTCD
ncbi:hypothetical protein MMC29_003227 [Sticta canariensis]|nr:hypothetical protein [Sticta canariensis]